MAGKGNYSLIGFKYDAADVDRELLFLAMTGEALDAAGRMLGGLQDLSSMVMAEVLFVEDVDGYMTLYYLNDAAVRMCKDIGFPLEVIKAVPRGELPANPGIQWRRPYLLKTA